MIFATTSYGNSLLQEVRSRKAGCESECSLQPSSYLDLDRYEAKCRVYPSLMNKIQNYVCFLVFKVSGIFY